jgi:hypothetical protein
MPSKMSRPVGLSDTEFQTSARAVSHSKPWVLLRLILSASSLHETRIGCVPIRVGTDRNTAS